MYVCIWWFPKMVVPNNHGVFLLKIIILGCFGGTTILGNIHTYINNGPSSRKGAPEFHFFSATNRCLALCHTSG